MLVTALSPVIGYDKASKIAHYAMDNDLTLRTAALKLGFVTEAEFDRVVDPKKMVRPYVARATANADANTTTEDMLTLYEANTGIDATPLWRGIEAQGLNPPEMRLVQELRSKVEFVAKQP